VQRFADFPENRNPNALAPILANTLSMNPYLVLNVPLDVTDDQVRRAYHAAVQECPPERDSARFQSVQEAYTHLKDERARWNWRLYCPTRQLSPMGALLEYSRLPGRAKPLGEEAMNQWLEACLPSPSPSPKPPVANPLKAKKKQR
jgi:DnaJ domain